ncbi:type VII secretion integral membrane protein EccD [Mycetocola reblochoni]|uniref:Type VII secretion integral membrane protein EccD n=2 Tax=Mycetocola reblochoni TaxID=331618 RepID=A0A3L6ZPG6_9MICO|nr:type VII secretion integral membrane protein EccD [Mycetocola reblochoni]RLP68942.1 type VII secretion integral membrane protein EccD [Mycetocola reblochoni]
MKTLATRTDAARPQGTGLSAPTGRTTAPAEAAVGVAGDMCRLSVVGPSSRVELAVPSHIPVAELLPTIVGHLDPALATRGLGHGGWVLQRLGHPPLDEDRGTAAAGLLDGDVLYLRPRNDELKRAQYDDLVDGVQTVLRAREDAWTPARTRTAALGVAVLAGLAAIAIAATTGAAAPLAAGVLAVVLLSSGALVDRLWDTGLGRILLGLGVAAAAVAGAAVPVAIAQGAVAPITSAASGAATAGVAAAAAASLGGARRPAFIATAGAAAVVVLGLAVPLLLGQGLPEGAAITLVLALALARVIPAIAAWCGGLVVDAVPLSAEDFQSELTAVPVEEVERGAAAAHAVVTALWSAWAVVVGTALVVLALGPGWASLALTATAALAALLQARELTAAVQRAVVLGCAALPLAVLAVARTLPLGVPWRIAAVAVLLAVVAHACVAALVLPGRRLAPTWGRTGDTLHWLCAIAIPALVLAVVGLYDWVADLV